MALLASTIMTLAGRALNDESAVRWTYAELCAWINEATGAVMLAKPSANSINVNFALIVGTLQSIGASDLALLRLVRNIESAGPPLMGGRVIRPTTRDILDAQAPDWHSPRKTPYKKEVRQFVYDEENPRAFYCYPGNDGTGIVEALVSRLPTKVVASGAVDALSSYAQDVGLQEIYQAPLLEYVLFRALSKESPEASSALAAMHYQAFAGAVGLKIQVEGANSPNARPGVRGQ
jgi:hypothetical protein